MRCGEVSETASDERKKIKPSAIAGSGTRDMVSKEVHELDKHAGAGGRAGAAVRDRCRTSDDKQGKARAARKLLSIDQRRVVARNRSTPIERDIDFGPLADFVGFGLRLAQDAAFRANPAFPPHTHPGFHRKARLNLRRQDGCAVSLVLRGK